MMKPPLDKFMSEDHRRRTLDRASGGSQKAQRGEKGAQCEAVKKSKRQVERGTRADTEGGGRKKWNSKSGILWGVGGKQGTAKQRGQKETPGKNPREILQGRGSSEIKRGSGVTFGGASGGGPNSREKCEGTRACARLRFEGSEKARKRAKLTEEWI